MNYLSDDEDNINETTEPTLEELYPEEKDSMQKNLFPLVLTVVGKADPKKLILTCLHPPVGPGLVAPESLM